jgi:hypothetical protein
MLLVELEWLNEVMEELHYISAAEGYWLPQLESRNRRAGVSTLVRPETSRSLGRQNC